MPIFVTKKKTKLRGSTPPVGGKKKKEVGRGSPATQTSGNDERGRQGLRGSGKQSVYS